MTTHKFQLITTAILLLIILPACVSQPDNLIMTQPSLFPEGNRNMPNLIGAVNLGNDGEVVIRCAAIVNKSGYYVYNWCFRNHAVEDKYFIALIHSASRQIKNTSAWLNGERKDVLFPYRVVFSQAGEDKQVRVYPNDGAEVDKYGEDYYSPQRIVYEQRFESHRILMTNCNDRREFVEIRSQVSASGGEPVAVDIEKANRCETRWRRYAQDSEFIPGQMNGELIAALRTEKMIHVQAHSQSVDLREDIQPLF